MRSLIAFIALPLLFVTANLNAEIYDLHQLEELGPNNEIDAETVYSYFVKATANDTIKCDTIVITSVLNLSNLPDGTIKSSFSFENTVFRGGIIAGNLVFSGIISSFRSATFDGVADFSGSVFEKDVVFWGTRYNSSVSFLNSSFLRGEVIFDNSVFRGLVDFKIKKATDNIVFAQAIIDSLITFSGDFHWIMFSLTESKGGCNFQQMDSTNVEFDVCEINDLKLENLSLDRFSVKNSTVTGEIEILHSSIDDLTFFFSDFLENVYFKESSINKYALFAECTFEKLLNLRDLRFNESVFVLLNLYYNNILVRWHQIAKNIDFGMYRYNSVEEMNNTLIPLELSFRNHGQYNDEDACYYYRKEKEREFGPSLSKHLSWITCGYFVRPFRVLLNSLSIIVLFTFIFFHFSDNLLKDIYLPSRVIVNKQRKQPVKSFLSRLYNAFFYSTKNFLTLSFDLPQNSPHRLHIFVLIESVIGWFLLTLFIISLSRVYIR